MEQMLDFDRFLSEIKQETLPVRVYGKIYRVRREIPAILMLTLALSDQQDTAAMGKAYLQAAQTLFGDEALKEFCRYGMSSAALCNLVEQTLNRIIQPLQSEISDDDGRQEDFMGKT